MDPLVSHDGDIYIPKLYSLGVGGDNVFPLQITNPSSSLINANKEPEIIISHYVAIDLGRIGQRSGRVCG